MSRAEVTQVVALAQLATEIPERLLLGAADGFGGDPFPVAAVFTRHERVKKLSDDAIAEAGAKVASAAKPMDNTDLDLYWRKGVVAEFVGYALREIRGDDMRTTRVRIARHAL